MLLRIYQSRNPKHITKFHQNQKTRYILCLCAGSTNAKADRYSMEL